MIPDYGPAFLLLEHQGLACDLLKFHKRAAGTTVDNLLITFLKMAL